MRAIPVRKSLSSMAASTSRTCVKRPRRTSEHDGGDEGSKDLPRLRGEAHGHQRAGQCHDGEGGSHAGPVDRGVGADLEHGLLGAQRRQERLGRRPIGGEEGLRRRKRDPRVTRCEREHAWPVSRCAATGRGVCPSANPRMGRLSMNVQRLIIAAVTAAVSLSLGLGGLSGGVLAQTNSGVVVIDDASGTNGTNGTCNDAGPRRTRKPCGDLRPDPGITGTDPSPETPPVATEVAPTPVEIVPPAAADPVPDTTSDPVATDSDGDGVADGDEGAVYGTDPGTWDTDGDGLSDGDELFGAGSDPLLWDTNGDGVSDGGVAAAADSEAGGAGDTAPVVANDTPARTTSGDSDADRLSDADEAAVGTDPTNPDSDGDGYYDGDEVNLETDPFDPASFPAP